MADYIKRKDAHDAVMNTEPVYAMCKDGVASVAYQKTVDVIEMINAIPSADVAPVKHGRWMPLTDCSNEGIYCSACHKKVYRAEYSNTMKMHSPYCPNCGAKMDEEANETNGQD